MYLVPASLGFAKRGGPRLALDSLALISSHCFTSSDPCRSTDQPLGDSVRSEGRVREDKLHEVGEIDLELDGVELILRWVST